MNGQSFPVNRHRGGAVAQYLRYSEVKGKGPVCRPKLSSRSCGAFGELMCLGNSRHLSEAQRPHVKLSRNWIKYTLSLFWFPPSSQSLSSLRNNAFQLTLERLLNKVQVSLKLKEVFVLFLKQNKTKKQGEKGGGYGTLPLLKRIYLNGKLAFSPTETNLDPNRI